MSSTRQDNNLITLASFVSFPGLGYDSNVGGKYKISNNNWEYNLKIGNDLSKPHLEIELVYESGTQHYEAIIDHLISNDALFGLIKESNLRLDFSADKNKTTKVIIIEDAAAILKFLHIARLEEEYYRSDKRYIKSNPSNLNENKDLIKTEKELYTLHKENKSVSDWGNKQIELASYMAKQNVFNSVKYILTHDTSWGDTHNYGLTEVLVNRLKGETAKGEEKFVKKMQGLTHSFFNEFAKFMEKQQEKLGGLEDLESLQAVMHEIRMSPYFVKASKVDFVKTYFQELNSLYDNLLLEIENKVVAFSPISTLISPAELKAETKEEKTAIKTPGTSQVITDAKSALQAYIDLTPKQQQEGDGEVKQDKAKPSHLGLLAKSFRPYTGLNKAEAYKKLLNDPEHQTDLQQNIILYALLLNAGPTLRSSVGAVVLGRRAGPLKDKELKAALTLLENRIKEDLPVEQKFKDLKKGLIAQINDYANEKPGAKNSKQAVVIEALQTYKKAAGPKLG